MLSLRLFHLNILGGVYLNDIIDFVQDNDFDIIQFQEVANGPWAFTRNRYADIDCFAHIREKLGEAYQGELATTLRMKGQPNSYMGNATFFKKEFQLIEKKIIWLKRYQEIPNLKAIPIQNQARCALSLTLQKGDTIFHTINTHLAWGPNPKDHQYKIVQAKRLYHYLENLRHPFVLSGDFNLTPETKVVKMFDQLGNNLTRKYQITNTLNPRIHSVTKLFPPGLAVDYIYTHPKVKVKQFQLIDTDLSDHFGLTATLTL